MNPNSQLILFVFLGGGLGSVVRFYISQLFLSQGHQGNIPYATIIANVVSCFILGYLAAKMQQIPNNIYLLLTAGFCGGLSTFSTLGLEIFDYLIKGQFVSSISYVLTSLILGIIAIWLGYKIVA